MPIEKPPEVATLKFLICRAPQVHLKTCISYIPILDSRAIFREGHGILCREYIMTPTRVLIQDPCPAGLPEISTGAHVERQRP